MHSPPAVNATLRIWGHRHVDAQLDVERYPVWAWLGRVVGHVFAWSVATLGTLILTFDPFIATFPFVIGIGLVHCAVRGRYRVRSFSGECPRCSNALNLKNGTKIDLPHRMDCFSCHFEPELHLGRA